MSDFDLIRQAERGDTDAFSTLFDRFHRMACTVAARVTGSDEDGEDATMEMWCWLLEGRWRPNETIRHDVTAHKFVATLARFAALKQLYRPFNAQPIDGDPGPVFARLHATTATPEQRVHRREFRRALREAFADLPRQYRRAAHLRYIEDLSCRQIGARMRLKGETIPGYLHQTRVRLRSSLAPFIDLPDHIRTNGYRRIDAPDRYPARRSPSTRTPAADDSPSPAAIQP